MEIIQSEYKNVVYDFYTVDLNNERSSYSGVFIENQSEYVCDVIYNILSKYIILFIDIINIIK